MSFMFHWRNKKGNILFGADGTHFSCRKDESGLRKKTMSSFEEISTPITMKHMRICAIEGEAVCGKNMSTPDRLIQLTEHHLRSQAIHVQSTMKQHDSLTLQRRIWVVSWLWTWFSYTDCKRSRPRNDKKSSRSLELDFVSKKRLFEQPSSASSNFPKKEGTVEMKDRSAFKCRCTWYGYKQVSGVWSGRYWILPGKWSVGWRCCPWTKSWYPFFPTALAGLEMGGLAENPILLNEEEDNENSPPTTLISERPARNRSRKRSWLCLHGFVSLDNTVYVFSVHCN